MSKNILLIDDDKLILMALKRLLTREGYKVTTAQSGQSALRRIKDDGFDLIISDIKMPGMDGLEVLRRIKNISPQAKVIMVTINDDADTRQKAKTLGADEFVRKPCLKVA